MFILALAMYGVRYIGYSYITCPWFAFPFEALEVFTLNLFMVAVATYVKVNYPFLFNNDAMVLVLEQCSGGHSGHSHWSGGRGTLWFW